MNLIGQVQAATRGILGKWGSCLHMAEQLLIYDGAVLLPSTAFGAVVAQLVEHGTDHSKGAGSNPAMVPVDDFLLQRRMLINTSRENILAASVHART